ncbi:CBS domain-containing protein [Lentzea aerocolonigenes]|uniref:CBS domain-containing protein n=1 Tax=Lentzea aerocolonigenes TaxID=68170 RepID=UPI0004C46C28|nr:CBS domain-containing protein [Lentzea aerocolonigenes]MCP2242334.1 CBS domain-containing protein [Lentzea aerocolonigenes]
MPVPTPPALIGKTVDDVLVRHPKTLPIDISVGQARACFTDDHVHLLLLTESGRLIGTLVRTDLREDLDDAELALPHSRMSGRTIPADMPAEQARELLVTSGQRRRAVIDDNGTLLGLLCLKRRLTGFCSDADVAARAAERAAPERFREST